MLLKKDYEGGLLAALIQDQEQMRSHDSRNHWPVVSKRDMRASLREASRTGLARIQTVILGVCRNRVPGRPGLDLCVSPSARSLGYRNHSSSAFPLTTATGEFSI